MTGQKPKNCAIAIGINAYKNIQSLDYAQDDAAAMRDYFQDELHFDQVWYFSAANDADQLPTYINLLKFLDDCTADLELKAGDNLWFFFAGHGIRYKNRDYLLPSDAYLGKIEQTAISLRYVTEQLTQCGSDNVILLIDACRKRGERTGSGVGGERYPGVVTFYSCSPFESSYEIADLQQGAFTHALLDGLRRQGEGNCATVERLDKHLSVAVPELNRDYGKPTQTPKAEVAPASKYHLILLPRQANDADVNQLRVDAFRAQFQGELQEAKKLWVRVLMNAPGDRDAVEAIGQIAVQLANRGPASSADRRGNPPVVAPNPQGRHRGTTPTDYFVQPATPKALEPQPSVLTYPFEFVKLDSKGRIVERQQRETEYFSEDLGDGVMLEMTAIPGGSFRMGRMELDWEQPIHAVTVQPFYMGKFAMTQEQWARVASLPKVQMDLDPDPARFKGAKHPVENVSWQDAIEFCARLSQHTGKEYRLPSEAEWEYACRAGTTTHYHFGDVLSAEVANYRASATWNSSPKGKDRKQTVEVQSFFANPWGLYQMHGNVWEWCADPWHKNYEGAPTDGKVWVNKNDNCYQKIVQNIEYLFKNQHHGVIRGGSWDDVPRYCRSAYRSGWVAGDRDYSLGFRVCRSRPGS